MGCGERVRAKTGFTDLQFHVLDLAVEGAFEFSDFAVPREESNDEVAETVLELFRLGLLEVSAVKETGPRHRRRAVRLRALAAHEAEAAIADPENWRSEAEQLTQRRPEMLPPRCYFQIDATPAGEDAYSRAFAERFDDNEVDLR
jgi:hypothetical protein